MSSWSYPFSVFRWTIFASTFGDFDVNWVGASFDLDENPYPFPKARVFTAEAWLAKGIRKRDIKGYGWQVDMF